MPDDARRPQPVRRAQRSAETSLAVGSKVFAPRAQEFDRLREGALQYDQSHRTLRRRAWRSTISTAGCAPRDRSRHWHETIAATYFPLDLRFAEADRFAGELRLLGSRRRLAVPPRLRAARISPDAEPLSRRARRALSSSRSRFAPRSSSRNAARTCAAVPAASSSSAATNPMCSATIRPRISGSSRFPRPRWAAGSGSRTASARCSSTRPKGGGGLFADMLELIPAPRREPDRRS